MLAGVVLLVAGLILIIPTIILFCEVFVGSIAKGSEGPLKIDPSIRSTILIPAHNEEAGIQATLTSVSAQMGENDRILVVADNCDDETARIAREHGSDVIERTALLFRGKGFALAAGIDVLRQDPPDVLIVVDADCSVSSQFVGRLKSLSYSLRRPVQAQYLMLAPIGFEKRYAVAEFAWRIKNVLRPSGLKALGFPCQLMGSGMAFPWASVESVSFASANLVEDLEMGVRMTLAGFSPRFSSSSSVESEFPISQEGELKQRQRWEGGSISMLLGQGLKTVVNGIRCQNKDVVAIGCDMLVPPLVIHAALIFSLCAVSVVLAILGGSLYPLIVSVFCLCVLVATIGIAWWSYGRDLLPVSAWPSLGRYVVSKVAIHAGRLGGRSRGWVRTDRTGK